MSGCKFFVDRIDGSSDLMVYHANTHKHGSPPHGPVNFQKDEAVEVLNALHANARNDYNAPAHGDLAFDDGASLAKVIYYGGGAEAERRKANRTLTVRLHGGGTQVCNPEFTGGCTIMGFYRGSAWSFYYQTWGDVEYDRPTGAKVMAQKLFTGHWKYLHKVRIEGSRHRVTWSTMKVVDNAKFYPAL